MLDKLRRAERLLQEAVDGLDPDVLEAKSAARLTEAFARLERLSSAGKALAARRMADSGVWRKDGERSPAHWLAKRAGTSVGQAVATIETAQRLAELPQAEQAVRKGRLSETQSREIASAAAASPSAEKELLEVAQTEGVGTLRQHCARVKAAATPDETQRYEKIFKSRYLRHWSEAEGAFRLDARLTPDTGALVVAALEPFKERVFKQARKQGRRESYDAYAVDALVEMAKHTRDCHKTPSRKNPGTLVRVLVDHKALARDHTKPGEVCEIEGIGPIPAVTAKALAQDSILAALATDGVDIQTVSHMGRKVTARQRTALEVRDPCCVVPGCDVRDHLEVDHITGVKDNGPTKLANLGRLCPWHHYLKTYKGYVLSGGPGKWRFEHSDEGGPDPPG
jgi:hypothetical protein